MTGAAVESETVPLSAAARKYVLAFADDEHLIGQRHTEWIGLAPFLEEDLAFASIAQDELGHAATLYATLVGDDDDAIDRLAFRRPSNQYRSCWFVEYETNDWAEALVRHWLYDAAEELRWRLLAGSAAPQLAAVVDRAEREEIYHRRHGDSLLNVLLNVDESRRRIEYAIRMLWPLALGLFDPVEGEGELIEAGITAGSMVDQLPIWRERVERRFPSIDWATMEDGNCVDEQRNRTERHEDFEALYGRMREVLKFDPDAVW